MKINFEVLLVLCDLFKTVPLKTPKRLELIYEMLKELIDFENLFCSREVIIDIPNEELHFQNSPFTLNIQNIAILEQSAPKLNYITQNRLHVPFILVPSTFMCCEKSLKIVSSYAEMKVYTQKGLKMARSYHSKCKTCNYVYYYSYEEDKVKGSRKFIDRNMDVLMFNSGIAFTYNVLKMVDNMICIGGISFEKAADIICATNGISDDLNPDRLEAAWFLYRILEFVKYFQNWPRKSPSKELDIETLCQSLYSDIKKTIDNLWLKHVCLEPGCKERFVVIDGNEKLYRLVCAAEKTKITGNVGEVNRYDMCIRNPIRGNQFQPNSKFCKTHENEQSGKTLEQIDMRPVTRQYAKMIQHVVVTDDSCKKEENVDKFHNRTAGMFYLFRSCGIRISHYEMYTSESLSDVFLCLLDTFGSTPEHINGIVYDRACGLHPFITRLSSEGNKPAKNYEILDYIVDIFHVEKHTQPKCILQNENCLYHPHLTKFSKVKGMNTEVAEQSFSQLNRFKYMSRKMSYSKRLLFFKFIDHSHNKHITIKHEYKTKK